MIVSGVLWLLVICPLRADDAQPLLKRLEIYPPVLDLQGVDSTHQLLVTGDYTNGLQRDVTLKAKLSISDPQLAELDGSRRLLVKGEGEFTVTAQLADQQSQMVVRVSGRQGERPFHFNRDIGTVLTRFGCNSTECHGSVKGRGGFKLSTDALFPQEDYRWITEGGTYQVLTAEAAGEKRSRIDREDAAKSLLLRKPTLEVEHEGGKHFAKDSDAYQKILNWIEQGAPYGTPEAQQASRIDRIEAFPRTIFIGSDEQLSLVVSAHLTAGGQEDLTQQVRYELNQEGVVEVDPSGRVRAVGHGETDVIVRAVGHTTAVRIAVVQRPLLEYADIPARNLIDQLVFAKLRKLSVRPSPLSSDTEFLRRVCLDLTGTLPPAERVREFLEDPGSDKRDKLIDVLLETPEYIDFWTFRFADFLRVEYNARQDVKTTRMYNEWIRRCIAENLPYDELARERIAAQGNAAATQNYYFLGFRAPHEIAAEQARVFLGIRLDCAQCHDHPFETFSQAQYWGLAAYFGRMNRIPQFGLGTSLVIDDPGLGITKGKVEHPRTKEMVQPQTLDGTGLSEEHQQDPRGTLAKWFTSPDNPYFSRAIVNRVWGYFFGRGLVDPVDDFRSTNPPTHPKLLDRLAQDFVDHDYDLKYLFRLIVQSHTYQLSGRMNDTNQADAINYSRAFPRALEAEVLLDAICQVTGVDEVFSMEGHPLAPRGMVATASRGTRAIDLVPELFPSQFLEIYGRHLRSIIQSRDDEASLTQALHMVVGSTYNEKLSQSGGRLMQLLEGGASNEQVINEFYLATVTRFPSDAERNELEQMLAARPEREQALKSLIWALLCSREFAYNH